MDALAQVAPVAQPLLNDVDNALATLGAPPAHPVWRHLRSLQATPAQTVRGFVDMDPHHLRAAAATLREQAQSYTQASIPGAGPWDGAAAEHYAVTAATVRDHLASDRADSMVGRLRALASAVADLADWQQSSRDALAGALAGALLSRQAMTVRSHPAVGSSLGAATGRPATDGLAEAVLAAADIGAALLSVAQDAVAAAQRLVAPLEALDELRYAPPAFTDPIGYGSTIRLY